jgi:hypothetical protein
MRIPISAVRRAMKNASVPPIPTAAIASATAPNAPTRSAGALLERWRWAAGSSPWFVLATLEHGRVAERLGEREKAIESYRFVTEAWRRADHPFRSLRSSSHCRGSLGLSSSSPARASRAFP